MSINFSHDRDDSAIEDVIGRMQYYAFNRIENKEILGPIPKYFRMTVRPAGSNFFVQYEIPLATLNNKQPLPATFIRDELKKILKKARNTFGNKNLYIKVISESGDKIVDTMLRVSVMVENVLANQVASVLPARNALPPPPLSMNNAEPEPLFSTEAKSGPTIPPASSKKPELQPIETEVLNPKNGSHVMKSESPAPEVEQEASESESQEPEVEQEASESEPQANGGLQRETSNSVRPRKTYRKKRNNSSIDFGQLIPDAINFSSMKYYPTDSTAFNIRKAFLAIGIVTKPHLLQRLKTTTLSKLDWQRFVSEIRSNAAAKGVNFHRSSEDTLYWWLTKKAQWIQPIPEEEKTEG